MDGYLAINQANWDERAAAHAASVDYAVEKFIDDPGFLSGVVRFDLPRLGDLSGLRGVHFIRELHPMLSSLDVDQNGRIAVEHAYFERDEAMFFDGGGTYVQTDVEFATTSCYSWSHGLGETITALMHAGLQITQLVEHDSVPWLALPGQMSIDEHGEWRLTDRPWRLAASFTLQAQRVSHQSLQ